MVKVNSTKRKMSVTFHGECDTIQCDWCGHEDSYLYIPKYNAKPITCIVCESELILIEYVDE